MIPTARDAGCQDIILLKCTSTYPATSKNSNILTIPHMRDLFGYEVGLSDYTLGIGAAVAAVAPGETVIEKHFTQFRAYSGVNNTFSIEPAGFRIMVGETECLGSRLGVSLYRPGELKSGVFFLWNNLR